MVHIFRHFFVSTFLIPVLLVVVASDESHGLHHFKEGATPRGNHDVFDSILPLLLKFGRKFIPNSTNPNFSGTGRENVWSDYDYGDGDDEVIVHESELLSWSMNLAYKVVIGLIVFCVVAHKWHLFKWVLSLFGIGEDYIEYYIKLGNDGKHPFGSLEGPWIPTIGISLKKQVPDEGEPEPPQPSSPAPPSGWGWGMEYSPPPHPYYGQGISWEMPPDYGGWGQYGGWPMPMPVPGSGWGKGWSESQEEEDNLRHKFDKKKGWKIAKKYAKKYGKWAHKYGLKPSKYASFFDEDDNFKVKDTKGTIFDWSRSEKEETE